MLSYVIGPFEFSSVGAMSSIANMELARRDSLKGKHADDVSAYGESVSLNYNIPVAEVYNRLVIGFITQKGSLPPLIALYIPPKTSAMDLPSSVLDFPRLETTNPLVHMRNGNRSTFPRIWHV